MTKNESLFGIGTAGLALAALGAFLPWARVGGRNRSGFSTADTFISLSTGALPDALAWVGRWWYAPAFLALAAWATLFGSAHWAMRAVGVVAIVIAVSDVVAVRVGRPELGRSRHSTRRADRLDRRPAHIGIVCTIRSSSVLRA